MLTAYAIIGLIGALGVGLALRYYLLPATYRYDDELGTRRLRLLWLPVVTTVTLPLVAIGGWRLAGWSMAVVQTVAAIALLVLAVIDVDVRRLPDRITKPLLVATAVGIGLVVLVTQDVSAGTRAVLAAVVLAAMYFALAMIGGGTGMGLGDVKLAPTLGLLLGFHSWAHVVLGTTLAFLGGTLWGLALIVLRRGGLRSAFAFGPFMIGGALVLLMIAGIGPILDHL